jgi:hypothetical protein
MIDKSGCRSSTLSLAAMSTLSVPIFIQPEESDTTTTMIRRTGVPAWADFDRHDALTLRLSVKECVDLGSTRIIVSRND